MKSIMNILIIAIVWAPKALAKPALIAIGLMSGTSMDGIDVALLKTDGQTVESVGPHKTYAYSAELKNRLRTLIREQKTSLQQGVERDLTQEHIQVVQAFMKQFDVPAVDVIGFHGHTVIHLPDQGKTVQIGDGEMMAKALKTTVVYDFRTADVAAGGQGAPLAPIYHKVLVTDFPKPVVLVNIGGVANVTYLDDQDILAFDTGPGNALIDDWVYSHTGQEYDDQGRMAATGQVQQAALDSMLDHPYFGKTPPKSLDRNDFADAGKACEGFSLTDGCATLTAFTAASLAKAQEHFPKQARTWIISGGGRHNAEMMRMVQDHFPQANVIPVDQLGHDGDAVEAELFAYLAVRSLYGLPNSFPGTTGVANPVVGGKVARYP
ncbi:MAG: anhydro-N-acetylmuramic acid kinase [Alphaproteobacteria bacterium]